MQKSIRKNAPAKSTMAEDIVVIKAPHLTNSISLGRQAKA
jgi:hypothetical protein